ncbi:hypothetical protein [uncultured Xylophilus sp.]|uniref:hypothetical protein n=1 Tax=uncultured Xylophilus sp. TaxID=296832 RepID=UPI0025E1DEC1|nr:hypothetical protein [uncultured Xylophilus sp.]
MTAMLKPSTAAFRGYQNYVLFSPESGRAKVGITADLRSRLRYYRQESRRNGLGYVAMEGGAPQQLGIARLVKTELCRALKSHSLPGHGNWVKTDADGFMALVAMTRRFQNDILVALGEVETDRA